MKRSLCMKRSLLACYSLVIAALAAGCAVDEANLADGESVGDTFVSFEEFETTVYQEPETGVYIVDGDTPIENREQLELFYEQHVRSGALIVNQVAQGDDRWSDAQKLNLTYCVSTAFGSQYSAVVQAMQTAADAWQGAAYVKFVYRSDQDASCDANNTNVVFDVSPTSGQPYLARSFRPSYTRVNRNVMINSTSFGALAPWTLAGILRHELGHTLGFRHEHVRPEAGATSCFEDNSWRALTPYDSASVMHYPQCNGTNSGDLVLTQQDKDGAASLYGILLPLTNNVPVSNLSGATNNNAYYSLTVPSGAANLVFEISGGLGDSDLYVKFDSAPNLSTYDCSPFLNGNSETCTISNIQAGTYYVMLHAFSSYSGVTLKGSFTPPAPPPSGSITASPTSVSLTPGSLGSSNICWQTSNTVTGQVYVSVDGASEKLFAQSKQGCQNAAWIQGGHNYNFRLYADQSHVDLLNSVVVTGVTVPAPASGSITASPTSVSVTPGSLGSSNICWQTSNTVTGQVYVSVDGASEKLFAQSKQGCQNATWIQGGHNYNFQLYADQSHAALLNSVVVTGVALN